MNPLAVDIRELLLAYTPTAYRKYYIGREPNVPQNVVTLYDYGFGSQDPLNNIDENSIQFRSRNTNYQDGYLALSAIKLLLEGLIIENLLAKTDVDLDSLFGDPGEDRDDFIMNGSKYIGFWSQSNIGALGSTEKEYYLFTYNMRIIRSPVESGNRI